MALAPYAVNRVAEVREADAGLGQAIDLGSVDFAAMAAEVAESRIVGQHDDDVGAPRRG